MYCYWEHNKSLKHKGNLRTNDLNYTVAYRVVKISLTETAQETARATTDPMVIKMALKETSIKFPTPLI